MYGLGARRSLSPGARIGIGIALVTLSFAALAPTSFAAAPNPASGTATVDGDPSEWTSADLFADLTSGGNAQLTVRAHLSLRYDCDSHTLFALVMATGDGRFLQTRPEEAYLRIDGSGKLVSGLSGDDGTPPDFAWVDGDGSLAAGWEASGIVAPGSHTLRAHVLLQWDDADGYLPLDIIGVTVPLVLECVAPTEAPTATPTEAPTATPTEAPTPTPTGEVEPTATTAPTATPTATPTGQVEPTATAAPTATPTSTAAPTSAARTTLPPTDTGAAGTTGSGGMGTGAFIALLVLGAAMAGSGLALSVRAWRDD